MAKAEEITRRLQAQGVDAETIKAVTGMIATAEAEGEAGLIKTKKGALMVRVSPDRWPIAMYKKDWRILLAKIPMIEKALDEWDILETNPEPETTRRTIRTVA